MNDVISETEENLEIEVLDETDNNQNDAEVHSEEEETDIGSGTKNWMQAFKKKGSKKDFDLISLKRDNLMLENSLLKKQHTLT